jgi:hypothetical protein
VNRAGDRGAVDPVQLGQGLVRELKAQVNEGGDDPVGERQVMAGPRSGGALPFVSPSLAQPVFPGGLPRSGELRDQLAQPTALDPGPDTM